MYFYQIKLFTSFLIKLHYILIYLANYFALFISFIV